jgi:hypothetical protein
VRGSRKLDREPNGPRQTEHPGRTETPEAALSAPVALEEGDPGALSTASDARLGPC